MIPAHGRSGLNVWIPVTEESRVLSLLGQAGWAATGGERYRIQTPPAIRVTIATLLPSEARRFARDLSLILRASPRAAEA